MLRTLISQRNLIFQLTKRDILTRYRSSILGFLWAVLNPIFMLCVYTLVFGTIFKARWNNLEDSNQLGFALILFCGLTAYNIFAETISRAPNILANNPNYIKKVVFPLEILPLTILGTALLNGAISFLIIIIAQLIVSGTLHATILYLPIVILPLLFFTLGLSLFLASIGVYVRDIAHIVPLFVTATLFLSPIFYPAAALPEKLKFLAVLNPLGYVVEDIRRIVLWGQDPHWSWLLGGLLIGIATLSFGYVWFMKTKRGFADVI